MGDRLPSSSAAGIPLPDKGWELGVGVTQLEPPTTVLAGYWGRLFVCGEEICTRWDPGEALNVGDKVTCCLVKDGLFNGDSAGLELDHSSDDALELVLLLNDTRPVLWTEGLNCFNNGSSYNTKASTFYPVVDCFARTTSVSLVNNSNTSSTEDQFTASKLEAILDSLVNVNVCRVRIDTTSRRYTGNARSDEFEEGFGHFHDEFEENTLVSEAECTEYEKKLQN